MVDLVLERATHREKDDWDQSCAEVLTQVDEYLLTGGCRQHQVENDDVGPPIDRGVMGGLPVADGDAFEPSSLQHALDELEHLLVVIDHEHQVAIGLRSLRGSGFRRPGSSHDGHDIPVAPSESTVLTRRRRSSSVSSSARSAAVRISTMSALIASGSAASAPSTPHALHNTPNNLRDRRARTRRWS